ncbi:MAG TPA: hypothetical protein VKS78_13330, partial [Roseiarcus sp.]|nr:hypothetical protein [Roseiarcus sp.]
PSNLFFGDPPTRNQPTAGIVLYPAEVAKRKSMVATAISMAKATRPLSAANLQNWLDGKSATMVMSASVFQTEGSKVPQFLAGDARDKFQNACTGMLKSRSDPHGTLLPDVLTEGAVGPIRFLQFEDGVTPLGVTDVKKNDLFTAIGSFNVHSAIWVRATYKGKQGAKDVFDVEILRWCVQAYDVYDWNKEEGVLGGTTPFPLTDDQVKFVKGLGPLTGGAHWLWFSPNTLVVPDSWFRDLEVSGGGRAFLVRSEPFEAPQRAKGNFTISIDPATTPTQ